MITSTVTLMFIYLNGASKRSMFGFLSASFTRFGGDAITPNSDYHFPAWVTVKTRKEYRHLKNSPQFSTKIEAGWLNKANQ